MDLNSLLRRHQLALMTAVDDDVSPGERRAHAQFARDYAEQIHYTRSAMGAPRALPGSVT